MTPAAIVLAGGASRRFGRDKLAEPLDGRPLLELAIDAVRSMATEILVVVAPGDDRVLSDGVRRIHDPVAHEGPLAGLAAGLRALGPADERVIVLGGDMPSAAPAVLTRLVDRLGEAPAAWLTDDDDRPRPLPIALRRLVALATAEALLATGERRLRALPLALDAAAISWAEWRALDPTGGTLRDIDTPGDVVPPG